MKVCPFCGNKMDRVEDTIPAWFNPFKIIEEKRPALWRLIKPRLTGEAFKSGVDLVNEELHLHLCKKCGFYGIFDAEIDSAMTKLEGSK